MFNHDLSSAVEAGLPFISIDCFPCDPEGVTCMSLHFFTSFSAMFTNDTRNGKKQVLFEALFSRPHFKEGAGTGGEQSPGWKSSR